MKYKAKSHLLTQLSKLGSRKKTYYFFQFKIPKDDSQHI